MSDLFRRLRPSWLAVLALGAGLAPHAGRPPAALAADSAAADSARAALEARLEAVRREVEAERFDDDPFAAGPGPDLVIAATADAYGELAPCG